MMVQLDERNENLHDVWMLTHMIFLWHMREIMVNGVVYHIVIQKDFDILTYMIFITNHYYGILGKLRSDCRCPFP